MQSSKEWHARRIASGRARFSGWSGICCGWSARSRRPLRLVGPVLGLPLERRPGSPRPEPCENVRSMVRRRGMTSPARRLFHEIGEHRVDRIAGRTSADKSAAKRCRLHVMGGSPRQHGVRGLQPLAGQRADRCRSRPASAAAHRSRRHPGKSRCRLPASQTHSGRPRRDASRESKCRRRRPSRCRRSARHRACG